MKDSGEKKARSVYGFGGPSQNRAIVQSVASATPMCVYYIGNSFRFQHPNPVPYPHCPLGGRGSAREADQRSVRALSAVLAGGIGVGNGHLFLIQEVKSVSRERRQPEGGTTAVMNRRTGDR